MSGLNATLDHNGVTYYAEIAKVESTMLGVEDHGLWTAMLRLTGLTNGWAQTAGGYALDTYDEASKKRVATAFGMSQIMSIVETLGCRDWEHVAGCRLLVLREQGQILGIADLSAERVMIFADHAAYWLPAKATT